LSKNRIVSLLPSDEEVRVALVSSGIIPIPPIKGGGVEAHIFNLAKALSRLNVEVEIIDSDRRDKINNIENIAIRRLNVPNVSLPSLYRFNTLSSIINENIFGHRVAKFLKYSKYDLIHVHTVYAGFHIVKVINMPIIYTCHNPLWNVKNPHLYERVVVRKIESFIMKKAKLVIAVAESLKRNIIRHSSIDPSKILAIPNGVDINFFNPHIPYDNVERKYSLENSFVILFVGRVVYNKGIDTLIRAMGLLTKKYENIKCLIVGPLSPTFNYVASKGSYIKFLINLVSKLNLRHHVIFTGLIDIDELRALYARANVTVLPSYFEAMAMTLLEAMASGTPVIGSRIDGIRDVIIEGVNGYMFKKGDYRDLASKIELLLTSSTRRRRLSANARRIAINRYSWESVARSIYNAYRNALMRQ